MSSRHTNGVMSFVTPRANQIAPRAGLCGGLVLMNTARRLSRYLLLRLGESFRRKTWYFSSMPAERDQRRISLRLTRLALATISACERLC